VPDNITSTPQEGNRSEWTAIITGVINVAAVIIQTLTGWDFPPEFWAGVNTVGGTLFAFFLARKSSRTEVAANQAAGSAPKQEPTA
jgi:hypothetical protein